MYCKGYGPGGFTGYFGEGTKAAVIRLQTDAGLPIRDGKVYAHVFKAFLTMNAYVLTANGDPRIREMQQNLNNRYYKTSGVQPCDGHYQRNTNKALVYGLQTEIGIPAGSQTGSIGPATIAGLPTLSLGSSGNFVELFQYALYVNNYDPGSFNGDFSSVVQNTVREFQSFTELPVDGIANKQTWLSALVSTGDPTRKGTACDCITEITTARGKTLVDNGYKIVGRYLANAPKNPDSSKDPLNKKLQPGELSNIFNAGLSVFPIYQIDGSSKDSFSLEQGKSAYRAAYSAARKYGFKKGTTIYFSIDFDALGGEIQNYILPYFEGVNEVKRSLGDFYKIGVYGPRNACIQVSEAGYASTSFVSGMSTGFSGNLGYPLPANWAFDQIATIKLGSSDGFIEIDNNINSGRDPGASSVTTDHNTDFFAQLDHIQYLAEEYLVMNGMPSAIIDQNILVTNYYRHLAYYGTMWQVLTGNIDQNFVNYVYEKTGQKYIIDYFDTVEDVNVGIQHIMATIAGITYSNAEYELVADFSGWAGDLVTLIKDTKPFVEGADASALYDLTYTAASRLLGSKTLSSHFPFEDLIGDVDAQNISNLLNASPEKQLATVVKEYYEGDLTKRYSTFVKERFGTLDGLRKEAEDLMTSLNPLVISFVKMLLGDTTYVRDEGLAVAHAFADKMAELVNQ